MAVRTEIVSRQLPVLVSESTAIANGAQPFHFGPETPGDDVVLAYITETHIETHWVPDAPRDVEVMQVDGRNRIARREAVWGAPTLSRVPGDWLGRAEEQHAVSSATANAYALAA